MKIRTFLGLQAAAVLSLLGVLGGLLLVSTVERNRAVARQRVSQDALQGAFELNLLTDDYLLHTTDRAREQWDARYRSISKELDAIAFDDPGTAKLLGDIRRNFAEFRRVFLELAALAEAEHASAGTAELREALAGQLLVEAQRVVAATGRLYERQDARLARVQARHTTVTGVSVLLLALLGVGTALLLQRRIARPIEEFHRGVRALATGDLAARVRVESFQELEALSRAFNDMTAALRASRASLEEEIAHRRAAEAELAGYAQRLERSNRDLQDFAYIASHDLQEPLRKIQSFGDRLRARDAEALGPEGKDYLARMLGAAARMRALIDSLLVYSRLSTRLEPMAPVDLSVVAREAAEDLEARREETGGALLLGELPTVEASPAQMRQLLQNLLANGLKYHREGIPPIVRVTGHTVREGGTERVELTVEDNGIGFDEKYRDRIFAPFQRLHGRGEYEGTGMGLAICRKIVERHGGTIEARSTPGEGSRFLVRLPVRQRGETAHDPAA